MAYHEGPTSTAEHRNEKRLTGREIADSVYAAELRKAKTIGDLENRVKDKVAKAVQHDADGRKRAEQLQRGVRKVAEAGSADIKIDQELEGTGVQGYNENLSTNTAISTDPLSAEGVTTDLRNAQIIAAHERSEEVGHAGHSKKVEALVDTDGEVQETEMIYEGNNENKTEEKYGKRDGQPEELYGEGQEFVERVGAKEVNEYARKGNAHEGDRVRMQSHIFSQSNLTPDQMRQSMEKAGYGDKDVSEIMNRVRGQAAGVMPH